MVRTIFWSWQSDAPKRETRDLIQVALYAAVQDVAAEYEKARRVEVDQDVRGVVGLAPIAETILDKIDAATIFVGDVTPVAVIGRGRNRKLVPNPNVMIELGYARHSLGMNRLIPVFNQAIRSTRFEDLPFDLRHLTGAIGYVLPKGAPRAELRRVRVQLRKRFAEKLRVMIEDDSDRHAVNADLPQWHASLPSDPSIWEEGFNPLPVNCPHMGQVDVVVAGAPRIYVRLLPSAQGTAPKSYSGIFPGGQEFLIPLASSQNLTSGRTGNGHAVFESVGDDRTSKSIARWYKDTGEIWAISAWGFYHREEYPHLGYDEVIKDIVHWLERAIRSASAAGGSGPFQVKLGASGLRKVRWWQSRPSPGAKPFLGLNDFATSEGILIDGSDDELLDLVNGFMEELTDNFGVTALTREQIATLAGKT